MLKYEKKNVTGSLATCFLVYKTHTMIRVPILQDGWDKQCHPLLNCYQFLPKRSSQREALGR